MGNQPAWLENTLQGLVFWVGYYTHYRPDTIKADISEASLVFEACNLLYAHTGNEKQIKCEVLYRDLGCKNTGLERADIVLFKKNNAKGADKKPAEIEVVIEVKKANAGKALIFNDIKRLSEFINGANADSKAYLLVVSQGKRPKKLVTENGCAIKRTNPLGSDNKIVEYKVRRVIKASHSFKSKGRAHYVCSIEVLPGKGK